MIKVSCDFSAARDALKAAHAELDDMTPIYAEIVEYMIKTTRERFIAETAPNGTKWAPKKPSTLDRYRKLGYGGSGILKTLVGPGKRLSREIMGDNGLGLFNSVSRKGALIGSALLYSRVMQDGAEKGAFGKDRHGRPLPWGRIPARTWLGVSRTDEEAIIAIVDENLMNKLGGK